MAYLSRFDKIKSVDYTALRVNEDAADLRGKRILILEDTLDPYYTNYLATPFLNWNLSKDIFQHPDYYANVTQVYSAFKNDPPAIVVDSHNLLGKFFSRMPEVGAQYSRQGDRYVRISN